MGRTFKEHCHHDSAAPVLGLIPLGMRNYFKVVDMISDAFEVGLEHPASDGFFAEKIHDVLDHDGQWHVRGDVMSEREKKVTAVPNFAASFFQSFFGYSQR